MANKVDDIVKDVTGLYNVELSSTDNSIGITATTAVDGTVKYDLTVDKVTLPDISGKNGKLRFYVYNKAPIDALRIPPLLESKQRRLQFAAGVQPYFEWEAGKDLLADVKEVIGDIMTLLDKKEKDKNEK